MIKCPVCSSEVIKGKSPNENSEGYGITEFFDNGNHEELWKEYVERYICKSCQKEFFM